MLKNNYVIALIALSGSFILGSCSSIYMPNVPATPMFRQQGEGYLAGHINLKGNASGTAAVSLTDHVALLANASTVNHGRESNTHFRQWLAEGAVGYFTEIGKSKRQILEIYGGYGLGNSRELDQRASIRDYEVVGSRKMDFDKIFLQVNYSSTTKGRLNLFGGKRVLNYGTTIRVSRGAMTDFWLDDVQAAREENLFIEPVFFTRMELLRGLQLQYTTGFNIGVVNNSYLNAGNSIFTLGVAYNFGRSGNKKK
ncbi:hypothetical protein [Sphingobacterium faecale]|uniref:DUF481 domain-containing protein n=1 Tax=Sphingobacterium faecale TaxID=2803775 RepID=A0ABS1QY95_9SPHI|nr:hypothetical protein [Sphingobacterium faecale]MBL1407405.1 hypothetical protein [Sphingobacterium faecale]